MSASIEIWRGAANAWEADHLGHLNTRFYLAKVEEALPTLLDAAGIASAGPATIAAQHMRFHKEVRAGTPLHATGQPIRARADGHDLLVTLHHSQSGDLAASFRFSLSGILMDGPSIAAAGETPPYAIERGFSMSDLADVVVSGERALALGLPRTGLTALLPHHCDGQGIWRLSAAMGLIADAIPHMSHGDWRDILANAETGAPRRIGNVLLELGFIHYRWPRAGDRVEVRSVLTTCTDRITRTAHWLFDPTSGEPWAKVATVGMPIDLDSRRSVALTPEAQQAYRAVAVADA